MFGYLSPDPAGGTAPDPHYRLLLHRALAMVRPLPLWQILDPPLHQITGVKCLNFETCCVHRIYWLRPHPDVPPRRRRRRRKRRRRRLPWKTWMTWRLMPNLRYITLCLSPCLWSEVTVPAMYRLERWLSLSAEWRTFGGGLVAPGRTALICHSRRCRFHFQQ